MNVDCSLLNLFHFLLILGSWGMTYKTLLWRLLIYRQLVLPLLSRAWSSYSVPLPTMPLTSFWVPHARTAYLLASEAWIGRLGWDTRSQTESIHFLRTKKRWVGFRVRVVWKLEVKTRSGPLILLHHIGSWVCKPLGIMSFRSSIVNLVHQSLEQCKNSSCEIIGRKGKSL